MASFFNGSVNAQMQEKLKKATFAAGCFWGVEKIFSKVPGVVSTMAGYAGGKTANPSYEQICTGGTGHAETVEVTYDPAQVSYEELLATFFEWHDPTTLNRQGPDVGSQYRSAILFHEPQQQAAALAAKKRLGESNIYKGPIVTEIVPAGKFYRAEEYHQKYLVKNPNGTCSHVLQSPRAREVLLGSSARKNSPSEKAGRVIKSEAQWKKALTPEQFAVLRKKGTERAFTGKYHDHREDGVYRCAACGQELFDSKAKFESGTGWPSFFEPAGSEAVHVKDDFSFFTRRTEVLCARCDSHLGHLFDDGPPPTAKRYCINSVSLDFKRRK